MTRVLVLGGGGMLGHKMFQVLQRDHEVFATFRRYDPRLDSAGIFDHAHIVDGIDAWDIATIRRALSEVRPDVVVNCIGLIKQRDEARSAKASIYVNALFPHLLCECAGELGVRVIHISTDCVFSGKKGDYSEEEPSDAVDLYGKAKHLGEVAYKHSLTLRTSIVGRDLFRNVSLIDWFLGQSGKVVQGYTGAIYTGLSSHALSSEIGRLIDRHPTLHGLYHISSSKITKYELLTLVNRTFEAGVEIRPFDGVICDRSLRSDRYRTATGFAPPSWEEMIAMMAKDQTPYDRLRQLQN